MKYRAKVTWVKDLVAKIYRPRRPQFLKDKIDVYIEVDTLEQAECLERMNKAEHERLQAEIKLLELLNI